MTTELVGLKVFVYWNLHKNTYSIRAMEGEKKGRVVGYADLIYLENARGKVSEAGRLRVIREKSKNVHAGIVGYVTDRIFSASERLRYNPYETDAFVFRGSDVWEGGDVLMTTLQKEGKPRAACYV